MNDKIKFLQEWLDERRDIMETFQNPPDSIYYKGAVDALTTLGYDCIYRDGKHIVIPPTDREEELDDDLDK